MASHARALPTPPTPSTAASTSPGSTPGPSDDPDSAQRRGRQSRPKVKTGCSICKQRRIKCDEKRPACTQCVRSHKDCTGYPPPSRHAASHAALRIAPRPVAAAPAAAIASQGPSPITGETVLPRRRANRRQLARLAAAGSVSKSPAQWPRNPSPTLYRRPSACLPLQGVEVHYFELFRAHTASELSGYFDSVFWTQRVLQECHVEPAIRHAAVALGALYKTLEQSTRSPSPPDRSSDGRSETIMSHWHVAIRQYSAACNAMMLLNCQTGHSHRIRLMASVLLASFDAFVGDHKQAIVQIQNGLGLLERLRAEQVEQGSSSPSEAIEEELVVMFTRLAIQAKSYDMAFHFPEPYVIRLTPEAPHQSPTPCSEGKSTFSSAPPLNQQFLSLREARMAFDRLCEKGLRFMERLRLAKDKPSPIFPKSWRQYGLGFKDQIDAWAKAYQPLLDMRHSSTFSPREKAGTAMLKMFQINMQTLFLSLFGSTETQFDDFTPQFQTIVDLGQEIVTDDERRAAAQRCPRPEACHHRRWAHVDTPESFGAQHIKPSFSADMGIVPPLFVVATKCRDPNLRRRAVQLLQSSARREGMWDSELAARIGQWVMEIEETDGWDPRASLQPGIPLYADTSLGHGANPAYKYSHMTREPIPEEKRVMIQSVDFDLRARFAEVKAGTRGLLDASAAHDQRRKETFISW